MTSEIYEKFSTNYQVALIAKTIRKLTVVNESQKYVKSYISEIMTSSTHEVEKISEKYLNGDYRN